ncbi:S41 family peptidase [Chryseobacterium sp. RLHN22]|uniref:S41 family peptidase n=1 Tax=Chryseobacterium sp. RLHN22 TaxID=3437885 RepID=UPI003D9AF186
MKTTFVVFCLLTINIISAQKVCNDLYNKKFTKQQLDQDVDFIKEKILNAHVSPFTEISKEEFEKKYTYIRNSLKDGMTQRDFYYLAKPLIVTLNDEHSSMSDFCVTDSIKKNNKVLPLKFKYENEKMILTEDYSDKNLKTGDEVVALNSIPIKEILENCAKNIPGTKEERISIAVDRFWAVISKYCYFFKDDYLFEFKSGMKTTIKSLSIQELQKKDAEKKASSQNKNSGPLEYKKIQNSAYLSVNTFNEGRSFPLKEWKQKLDSIFMQIKNDNVEKLVIDVSNNSGGNSAIANLLIDYFSDKPYKSYQGKFKKSQEYSDFLKGMGKTDLQYEKIRNGDYYSIRSRNIKPSENKNRFKGKTYVVVGKNTFSSAMMFGVMVLDNKLAEVVGEIPSKGHPNHFGELISFQTPHTKLDFLFGVKEWIRPAGNLLPNKLIPEKIIDLEDKNEEEIILNCN